MDNAPAKIHAGSFWKGCRVIDYKSGQTEQERYRHMSEKELIRIVIFPEGSFLICQKDNNVCF